MSIDGIDPMCDGDYDIAVDGMANPLAGPAFAGNACTDGTTPDSVSPLQELSGLADWGADRVIDPYLLEQTDAASADSASASLSPFGEVVAQTGFGLDGGAVNSVFVERDGGASADVTESISSSQDQGTAPTEGHAGHDQTPFGSAQCTKSECNQNISSYQSKVDHWKAELASAENRLQKALSNGDVSAANSAKSAVTSASGKLADAKSSLAFWKSELSTATK